MIIRPKTVINFAKLSSDTTNIYVTVFVALWFCFLIFGNMTFDLVKPDKLFFSDAVLNGINASQRVSIFYRIIFTFSLLLFLFQWLVNLILKKFPVSKNEKQTLNNIATVGIVIAFTVLTGQNTMDFLHIIFTVLLLKFSLYTIVYPKLKGTSDPKEFDHLSNMIVSIFFLAWFAYLFLFNSLEHHKNLFIFSFIAAIITLHGIVFLILNKSLITAEKIAIIAAPLVLIPFLVFFSGEAILFFKFRFDILIRYKFLFAGFFVSAAIIFYLVGFFATLRNYLTLKNIWMFFFIPSLIFGFTLFAFYSPFREQPTDIFELANPANAMMRIFKDGEIPILDFLSSHMLFEQWYGIIYHWIFGYDGNLDFLSYDIFNHFIFSFLIYFTLQFILKSHTQALFFSLTFPYLFSMFFEHTLPAVLALFFLHKLIKEQSISRYYIYFLLIPVLILWRLDTGSASLYAAFIILPLALYMFRINLEWKKLLLSIGLLFATCLISVLVSLTIRDPELILSNFRAALHYATANQAHAYANISRSFHHQFFIHHFLLPLLAVIAIILTALKIRAQNLNFESVTARTGLSGIFFLILYLANAQRGLIRHSFMHTDLFLSSSFFVGIALLLTFWFLLGKGESIKFQVLVTTMFLSFLFMRYFPIGNEQSIFQKAITNIAYQGFDNHLLNEIADGRVASNPDFEKRMFLDLKEFLDHNLDPEETFLDFSNTPMLYFYCQRPVPGYFNQNLQNTVDDFLQMHLLENVKSNKVPVVVFSNIPPNWFDATDGVPNVMRYYLVAEYIFMNYKPLGVISGKSIWIARDRDFDWEIDKHDNYTDVIRNFDYKLAAYFTSEYFKGFQSDYLHQVFNFKVPEEIPNFTLEIELPYTISTYPNVFLEIKIDSEQDFEMQKLSLLDSTKNEIGSFTFHLLQGGKKSYYLRLGNHYHWIVNKSRYIKMGVQQGVYPKEIIIHNDIRLEHKQANTSR